MKFKHRTSRDLTHCDTHGNQVFLVRSSVRILTADTYLFEKLKIQPGMMTHFWSPAFES